MTSATPGTLGAAEVEAFLNHLAHARRVSASTQTQALNALVFLYEAVLEKPLGQMSGLKRIQRRQCVPVVLTRDEVKAVLSCMEGTPRLMAELMYGSGLRVGECVALRVKDIDSASASLSVRAGKGGKDRTTVLPSRLHEPLKRHLLRVAELHKKDLSHGAGLAPLPGALHRKYPSASSSLAWQFVFPSSVLRPWSEADDSPAGMLRIRRCSGHSALRSNRRACSSTPVCIRCGIRSLPTCSPLARIYGPSNCCLATAACRQR